MTRTQPELARLAGVSLSTVARWMKDPDSVREENRAKLERANSMKTKPSHPEVAKYDQTWSGSRLLTPRQAFIIVGTIDKWQDYVRSVFDSIDIDEIPPFDSVDSRALFPVAGNKLWLKYASEAMRRHIGLLAHGIHPVEDNHSFFDELLFAFSIVDAPFTEDEYHDAEIEMPGEIPLGDDTDDDEIEDAPWDGWESLMERVLIERSPVSEELAAILPFDEVDPHMRQPDISEVKVPHPFTWFNSSIDSWWKTAEVKEVDDHV